MAAVVFGAIAPTLTWPEFMGGNENIVVQTALEMRHSGPAFSKSWLVPTMLGEPRVKKPPLVAWLTALAMRPATIAALDSPATRIAAYRDLAWQVRWTGLLAGCVMMLATFELGRLIGGAATGLCAAAAVATNLLFLKYMRQSTSDVHLAMWVVIANAAFVHGLLRNRWWLAATLGAFAAGMAFLCKGPVALLETALPTAVLLLPTPFRAVPTNETGNETGPRSKKLIPILCGVAIFCVIALPWFIHVYATVPNVWHTWFTEVSREGATQLRPDSVFTYFQVMPYMWPWVVFGAIGLIAINTDRRLWIPLLQVLVPLLIMVWVKDRKERYLLPMVGPAAVICGAGVAAWLRAVRTPAGWTSAVKVIHVAVLLGGAMIFLAIGTRLQTLDHRPWFSLPLAGWAAVVLLSVSGLWVIAQRRKAWAIVPYTLAVMLTLQALFIFAYSKTDSGRSPLKALAWAITEAAPGVPVYDWIEEDRRVDEELPIYMNRTIIQSRPEQIAGPAVIIMRESDTRPKPDLPPPWHELASATEKKNTWWAFVRK